MELFVYGTLKRTQHNSWLMRELEATYRRDTVTRDAGFTLVSDGLPFLFQGGVHKVAGEIWEVPDQNAEDIDRFERGYHKSKITLDDGSEALAYFARGKIPKGMDGSVPARDGTTVYYHHGAVLDLERFPIGDDLRSILKRLEGVRSLNQGKLSRPIVRMAQNDLESLYPHIGEISAAVSLLDQAKTEKGEAEQLMHEMNNWRALNQAH